MASCWRRCCCVDRTPSSLSASSISGHNSLSFWWPTFVFFTYQVWIRVLYHILLAGPVSFFPCIHKSGCCVDTIHNWDVLGHISPDTRDEMVSQHSFIHFGTFISRSGRHCTARTFLVLHISQLTLIGRFRFRDPSPTSCCSSS